MGIGHVQNVEIITLHGAKLVTAVKLQKETPVEKDAHIETTVAETAAVAATVEVDNVETTVVETVAVAVVDTEVGTGVTIVVAIDVTEVIVEVDNVETTGAEKVEDPENNVPKKGDHHVENTRVAMTANQNAVTPEDLAGGAQKERVETVVAEISRGVFI
ncbi:MAG: hypothetical protein VYA86_05275 [Candidatus Thermoplasmatota archaeon]|nr:hypothetical protein [Candidatus Thermoplasmatota archaeon]